MNTSTKRVYYGWIPVYKKIHQIALHKLNERNTLIIKMEKTRGTKLDWNEECYPPKLVRVTIQFLKTRKSK
jgi:hypothetical protein